MNEPPSGPTPSQVPLPESPARESEGVTALATQLLGKSLGVSAGQTKRWGRRAWRLLKLAGLMVLSAVVIPIVMISLGLLLGPHGYEGVLAAPLAVLSAWALILFFGLRQRTSPQRVRKARLADLPVQVAGFVESQRRLLSARAASSADNLLEQLEQLQRSAAVLREDHPAARRLRSLLADDLTGLLDDYGRLPSRLRTRPLHGGSTPEDQLVSGLSTIEVELKRLQEDLSEDDLFSLASKQRYLELKYGAGGPRGGRS